MTRNEPGAVGWMSDIMPGLKKAAIMVDTSELDASLLSFIRA